MSRKCREHEAPDYRKAIVPHVVEFKDYNGALLIEFYDGDQNLVHVHKDERSDAKVKDQNR